MRARITLVFLWATLCLGCGDESCQAFDAQALWAATAPGHALICVQGDLEITRRSTRELAALANVQEVDGSVIVYDNPGLRAFPAMPHLRRIGGALSISGNLDLEVIGPLVALESVDGSLYVGENPKLHTLDLGGSVESLSSVFLAKNDALTTLRGFDRLRVASGDLVIAGNPSLASIELPALVEVEATLALVDNSALEEVELPLLTRIGSWWAVTDNGNLADLAGFAALVEVGDRVLIRHNDLLTELTLPLESQTPWSVAISDNQRLERVRVAGVGLSDGSTVTISGNASLLEITGFAQVTTLAGLRVSDNPLLVDMTDWSSLEVVTDDGLRIFGNASFAQPDAWFPRLTQVADLWVFGNTSLAPESAHDLASRLEVKTIARIGDNLGEMTSLDPCPWPGDFVCDEATTAGTGLCADDPEDCHE